MVIGFGSSIWENMSLEIMTNPTVLTISNRICYTDIFQINFSLQSFNSGIQIDRLVFRTSVFAQQIVTTAFNNS